MVCGLWRVVSGEYSVGGVWVLVCVKGGVWRIVVCEGWCVKGVVWSMVCGGWCVGRVVCEG